jgi:hypothetical protein
MKRLAFIVFLCLIPVSALAQDPHIGDQIDAIAAEIAGLSGKMDMVIGLLKGVQYLQWALIAEGFVISIHQMIPVWRHRQ